ncbi:hypothetical protein B7486_47505 [cyanobacterium TDX16]|nr:hypothetical protein B7486_47505 [cyanobacterium TDX16]
MPKIKLRNILCNLGAALEIKYMSHEFAAIDLSDFFSLLAVWELQEQCWELIGIERPKQAKAICLEKPSSRLLFPPSVSPDGIWGGICKRRIKQKKESLKSTYLTESNFSSFFE